MLGELITQAVDLNQQDEVREGVGMSSLGYCEMQLHKQFIEKKPKVMRPEVLIGFLTGTGTHDLIFKLLWKYRGQLPNFTYRKREKEVVLTTPEGRKVMGHMDLDIVVQDNDTAADLKVYDEGGFMRIEEPHEHYVDQLMLYAKANGQKKCLIIYLCKSGSRKGEFKEFMFEVDEIRVQRLLEKYDRIYNEKAEIPFKDPQESWQCGYCPFYKECWGVGRQTLKKEGVVELTNTDMQERYVALKAQEAQIKAEIASVKESITSGLNGERGEGAYVSAIFYSPKTSVSYDTKLLRQWIDPAKLKKCEKTTEKSGYYQLRVHK